MKSKSLKLEIETLGYSGEQVNYMKDDKLYSLVAKDDIPFCHKIALTDIPKGGQVIKYGESMCLQRELLWYFIKPGLAVSAVCFVVSMILLPIFYPFY